MYQPITRKARIAWRTARAAAGAGAFRLGPSGVAPPAAVSERVAPYVPDGGAFTAMRSKHPERYLALVLDEAGRPRTIVKVALSSSGQQALQREANAIALHGTRLPPPLAAPKVVAAEPGLLATEAVQWRPRRDPWRCPPDLAFALGRLSRAAARDAGSRWAHGDVAPWNLLRGRHHWVLLDWEDARPQAPPFFDLFHFLVQSHVLLGRPCLRAIVEGLDGQGWIGEGIAAYARGAGLDRTSAREHLTVYLRTTLASLDSPTPDGGAATRARRRMLARLETPAPPRRPQAEATAASDYRTALRTGEQAHHYDRVLYRPGSYDEWVWRLERGYLDAIVDRYFGASRPRYLDFACGAGRILAALEGRCREPTGVDVSSAMLELAAGKLTASRLVHGDITADPSLLRGCYDLVTAFRFFLNAQQELRDGVLRALHRLLADDGILVLNIHGHLPSLRSLSLLARRLRQPHEPPPRQLSYLAMRRLLAEHGFEVVESRGYGFLTDRWQRLLTPRVGLALERLGRIWPLKFLAVQQLLTCRKRAA